MSTDTPVHIDQQPLDKVDQFIFLGSIVMVDGSSDQNVMRRLGKAMAVMRDYGQSARLNQLPWENQTFKLYHHFHGHLHE